MAATVFDVAFTYTHFGLDEMNDLDIEARVDVRTREATASRIVYAGTNEAFTPDNATLRDIHSEALGVAEELFADEVAS